MSKIHFESNSQRHWQTRILRFIEYDMSKIHFESNSQLWVVLRILTVHWIRYVKDTFWKQFTTLSAPFLDQPLLNTICQRYILKAIHNVGSLGHILRSIEYDMSKIHFESNSQHKAYEWNNFVIEYDMSKIHFESNSQQGCNEPLFKSIEYDMSKIHFESNSQHKM